MKIWKITMILFFIMTVFASAPQPGNASNENRTISEILEDGDQPGEEVNSDPAEGAEQENHAPQNSEDELLMEDRSIFAVLLQLFSALAVVIAIMYFLLKFLGRKSQNYQSHQTLQNIGGVPLGQNKSVQLVRVGDRLLVVGVGESIQMLTEIEDKKERELLLQQNEPRSSSGKSSFFEKLKIASFGESTTRRSDDRSFQEMLENQLNDMKKARAKAGSRTKEHDK
ncbi:flagellar biosynthetic protein FliO [Alteribacillus sp. HJP-4]|uniref:flagellar biosynthetic protein FliO n=1 Tax=Alteribacillus sp. HJP-4 TaxID=2775394 RepID=UPI0035CCE15C